MGCGRGFGPRWPGLDSKGDCCDARPAQDQRRREGLRLFEQPFGFCSRTLIPTNYQCGYWNCRYRASTTKAGVEGSQGSRVMKEQQTDGSSVPVKRALGERNELGQTYLVRNASFEPSQSHEPRMRSAERCLLAVPVGERWGGPALACGAPVLHRARAAGPIEWGARSAAAGEPDADAAGRNLPGGNRGARRAPGAGNVRPRARPRFVGACLARGWAVFGAPTFGARFTGVGERAPAGAERRRRPRIPSSGYVTQHTAAMPNASHSSINN